MDILDTESKASRFRTFHASNPRIYDLLVALARQAKQAGRDRIGIRMLWEVVRWNLILSTTGDEEFKLNDHLVPHYARLIMANEPDLRGLFETRALRSGGRQEQES